MSLNQSDTIVAPATGTGDGGVAIIRLSGPGSIEVLSRLFQPATEGSPGKMEPRKLTFGTVTSAAGELLDECLAVVMPGPHSFTGEDVAEIQCHGGQAVVSAILAACLAAGVRLAEPGEFSKRAFLNGRMDLAQAEGLADLISARTTLARRLAMRQLRGGLSGKLSGVRSKLIDAAAEIEAHLDFPEEDIPSMARERVLGELADAQLEIERLLSNFDRARIAREGARVVLAGKPNAGKSSIFNALVGRERAIVSPHPGTTRDTIECTVDIKGIAVTLIDTAGMRDAKDEIERIGIERTEQEIQGADLILRVIDATERSATPGETFGRELFIYNKSDILPRGVAGALAKSPINERTILFSAVTRDGITALEDAIASCLLGNLPEEEMEIARARHAECLKAACTSLGDAKAAFSKSLSGEFVMVDLRDALLRLGEITGERLDEQILDRIFSTFCLGK